MQRLGYTRYVAQGGDWGTAVSAAMARQAPDGLARHPRQLRADGPARDPRSHPQRRSLRRLTCRTRKSAPTGKSRSRPITADTASSRAPARRRSATAWPTRPSAWRPGSSTTTRPPTATWPSCSPEQPYGAITREDWLDNTSLYWLTNTATSAARLYWQQAVTGKNFYAAADVSLPAAVTVFPEEYVTAPRSWTEKAYHNLIYFHQAEKGGHFAAWEQPQLFSEELRAAFRTLR